MKLRAAIFALFMIVPILAGISAFQPSRGISQNINVSPTATYDPLVEPPLPPNPTELELGENLYWHWCMPCHGDQAQGLTDEFRMIWEPDHQNCWERGCHGGLPRDEGFPIPTRVPALVTANQLAEYKAVQELADYLQATHPPQSPGLLTTEQYHAIAVYVFGLNHRPIDAPEAPAKPTQQTVSATQQSISPGIGVILVAVLILAGIFAFALVRKDKLERSM